MGEGRGTRAEGGLEENVEVASPLGGGGEGSGTPFLGAAGGGAHCGGGPWGRDGQLGAKRANTFL